MAAGGERTHLPKLLEHFGPDMMAHQIGNAEINACATALFPDAAAATINRQVITPISAVLNAHYRSIGKAAPQLSRRKEPRGRLRWLTPEEMERLLAAAAKLQLPRHPSPERFTLQKIAFLIGTGARASECFAADVADWNAGTRQWWLPGEATGAGKTESSARFVRLPERAVTLIGALPETGRAFHTAYGKEIALRDGSGGQMAVAFGRAADAAGLPGITPHTLRHTWATWFYAQTRDFGALMDHGGWSRADTANRYRKLAPDDLASRLFAHGWDFRLPSPQAFAAAPLRRVK